MVSNVEKIHMVRINCLHFLLCRCPDPDPLKCLHSDGIKRHGPGLYESYSQRPHIFFLSDLISAPMTLQQLLINSRRLCILPVPTSKYNKFYIEIGLD